MLAPRVPGWYNIVCKIIPRGLTAVRIAAMRKQASRVSLPFFGILGNRERGLFRPAFAVFVFILGNRAGRGL